MVEARPKSISAAEENKSQYSRQSSSEEVKAMLPSPEALQKTFEELTADEENDIMSHLDYRKLEMIFNDYNLMGGPNNALDMKTFIAVMLHHLPPPADRVALVRNLIELFEEIDVNGDKDLEWVEFTNHIID